MGAAGRASVVHDIGVQNGQGLQAVFLVLKRGRGRLDSVFWMGRRAGFVMLRGRGWDGPRHLDEIGAEDKIRQCWIFKGDDLWSLDVVDGLLYGLYPRRKTRGNGVKHVVVEDR